MKIVDLDADDNVANEKDVEDEGNGVSESRREKSTLKILSGHSIMEAGDNKAKALGRLHPDQLVVSIPVRAIRL